MEKQICSKCKIEKDIDEFYFRKDQNKYNTICKKCIIKKQEERYFNNQEENKAKQREYYYKNKDKKKEYSKNYFKKNFNRIKEKQQEYYNNNKQYIIDRQTKYYEEHKNERLSYYKQYRSKKENKEKINNYIKNKKQNDKLFEYSLRIRRLIKMSISKMGYTKRSKTYQLLGCDFETAYDYLLKTYKDNYGVDYDFKEKVHIDHIIPISTAKNENDINKLNHYTNLQLLKAKDNLEKSNKLDRILRRK